MNFGVNKVVFDLLSDSTFHIPFLQFININRTCRYWCRVIKFKMILNYRLKWYVSISPQVTQVHLNLLEAAEEVKIGRLVVGLLKKKILSLKSAESTDQVPVKLNGTLELSSMKL